MSITGHLAELRSRIIKSAVAVLAGVIVVVVVYDRVLTWLTAPYVALCRRSPADYCGMSYDTIADDVNLFTLDPVEGVTAVEGGDLWGSGPRVADSFVATVAVHRAGTASS